MRRKFYSEDKLRKQLIQRDGSPDQDGGKETNVRKEGSRKAPET